MWSPAVTTWVWEGRSGRFRHWQPVHLVFRADARHLACCRLSFMESMQGVSKTVNVSTRAGRPKEVTFTIPAGMPQAVAGWFMPSPTQPRTWPCEDTMA